MPLQSPDFLNAAIPKADFSGIANLFSNYYKGYEQAQTPQKLAQERLKAELQNSIFGTEAKYAPQMAESTLALNRAHQGLYGSQAQEHNLNAQKLRQDLALFKQMFPDSGSAIESGLSQGGGGSSQPVQPVQGGEMPGVTSPMQGEGNQMQPNAPQMNQQTGMQPQGNGQFSPQQMQAFRDAYLRKIGHVAQPYHHLTSNGEAVTYDPMTGGWTTQQVGKTPGETTTETELAKHNVEAIGENYKAYTGAISQKSNLQGVLKQIENPKFAQAVGPWKNVAAKYLAPDDVKELQASFNTLGKNIVTESAKSFSRLTNQEMSWLQTVLPTASDTLSAIKGKTKTLETLRAAVEQKTILKDQLMRKGIEPIMADQLADQQIDWDAIRREIKPTVSLKGPEGNIIDVPKYDAELIERAKKKGYQVGDY